MQIHLIAPVTITFIAGKQYWIVTITLNRHGLSVIKKEQN